MGPNILTRRRFLQASLVATAGLLLPRDALAASPTVDPYSGAIKMAFPLRPGSYQTPLADNWHGSREGPPYPWSHRTAKDARAHDGVDVYPIASQPLPPVFAPVEGRIAAVCTRATNDIDTQVGYRASNTSPPPWDYSEGIDPVANLPLYGNFVWILSTDPGSPGYFIFFCHLQNEPAIQSLVPDQPVTVNTQLGVMGDTGNAAGTPQLHVEIHYPAGSSYTCTHCSPAKAGMTSIDSFTSLLAASPQQRGPTQAGLARGQTVSGALDGSAAGGTHNYSLVGDGSSITLAMSYAPRDPISDRGVGFIIYDAARHVVANQPQAKGTQYSLASAAGMAYTVQVYDYIPGSHISYSLTAS